MSMKISNYIPIIGLALTLLVGAVCFNRCNIGDNQSVDTEKIPERDTITIHDTVRIDRPVPVEVRPIGIRPLSLPLWRGDVGSGGGGTTATRTRADATDDSVMVAVPIEQRHYNGEDYDAWVSGYDPVLDSLRIYRPLTTITQTQTITQWRDRRWGLSLGVGVVVGTDGRVSPGLFAGVSYMIWCK